MEKGFNIRINVNGVNKYVINEEFVDDASYLTETTSDASSIYYGINEDAGDFSVWDFDGTFRDIISDSISADEDIVVEFYIEDNKIGSGIIESADLVDGNKIEFHVSSVLRNLEKINFDKYLDTYTFYNLYVDALDGLGFDSGDLSASQDSNIVTKLKNTSAEAYFDNDNSYNIIDYICQALQLNFILDKEGKPLLVDSNPICYTSDVSNAINIPDSYIIGDVENDAFVTNKIDAIDIAYSKKNVETETETVVFIGSDNTYTTDNVLDRMKELSSTTAPNYNIFKDFIYDYWDDFSGDNYYDGGSNDITDHAKLVADGSYVETVKDDEELIPFYEKRKQLLYETKLSSDSSIFSYQFIRKLYHNYWATISNKKDHNLVKISNIDKYNKMESSVNCLQYYDNLYIPATLPTKSGTGAFTAIIRSGYYDGYIKIYSNGSLLQTITLDDGYGIYVPLSDYTKMLRLTAYESNLSKDVSLATGTITGTMQIRKDSGSSSDILYYSGVYTIVLKCCDITYVSSPTNSSDSNALDRDYANFISNTDYSIPTETDDIDEFVEDSADVDIKDKTSQFIIVLDANKYVEKTINITDSGIPAMVVKNSVAETYIEKPIPIGLEILCTQSDTGYNYPLGNPYNLVGFGMYDHPDVYFADSSDIVFANLEEQYNEAGVSTEEALSYGRKRLIPLSYSVSVYGDKETTSFENVDASTSNINTSKHSISLESNILLKQTLCDTIKTNVLKYYKVGVRTAKCNIFAKDFYNTSGAKVVDRKAGQIIDVNDIVCFNNDDSELWRVVGREINVSDDIYETLTLREIVARI